MNYKKYDHIFCINLLLVWFINAVKTLFGGKRKIHEKCRDKKKITYIMPELKRCLLLLRSKMSKIDNIKSLFKQYKMSLSTTRH